jgi:dienelactone hydrolase
MASLTDFELRTLPGLWRWYDQDSRKLAFHAESPAEVTEWQTALREQVRRLLGEFPTERCDPALVLIESADFADYHQELFVLQVQPGEFMPYYVLTPKQAAAPYIPVLALHGHGTWGAKSLVGQMDSPAEKQHLAEYHYDYARQMVRLGYLVYAPVLRGFAERMEAAELEIKHDHPDNDDLSSCARVSLNALMSGKTLMGLRVWDVMRLIDLIQARPDVQPNRLACVGLSGGGTLTMYATALDPRITCAYISGAVNTFQASLMSIDHCLCNFIPHIVEYAEMPEIAGLIAPRPLMIEGGRQDPIYPLAGIEAAAAALRQIYAAAGVADRFSLHLFDGVHRWDGAPIGDWLAKYL